MERIHDDEPFELEWLDDCHECRHLRLEGPDAREYTVVPADGGGWTPWSAALLRLLRRIAGQPTQALIVTQEALTHRYVQALIGHGIAHVEASSNVYLHGDSRLTADHEELLALLGWQPPTSDHDDPNARPANWSLPLVHGDWTTTAEVVSATLIGVFGFSQYLPITVRTFLADTPCKPCSWPDATISHP